MSLIDLYWNNRQAKINRLNFVGGLDSIFLSRTLQKNGHPCQVGEENLVKILFDDDVGLSVETSTPAKKLSIRIFKALQK